ncbi:MAG: Grx4 family monothiol glutaredoxin [Candidatus Wallbacteria bacterium]|nr:Grx4 family monothiol glutaredoxin [Candidatus Wallbacteria bacterium]
MDAKLKERFDAETKGNKVVVYMKGTAIAPMCGFSAAVAQILQSMGVKFHDVNVLADPEIREGIKEYTSWPTIPQVFIDGKFVGGCDILTELHQKGELARMLGQG